MGTAPIEGDKERTEGGNISEWKDFIVNVKGVSAKRKGAY